MKRNGFKILIFLLSLFSLMCFNVNVVQAVENNLDFNSDGAITIKDLSEMIGSYNLIEGDLSWNGKYDINNDGIIDIYDIVLVSKSIQESPKISSVNTSVPSPQKLGRIIQISATMSQTPPDTLYRFWAYFEDEWVLLRDYSPENRYDWQPTFDTNYILKVEVKNKNSSKDYDDFKETDYVIQNNLNIIDPGLVWADDLSYTNKPEYLVLHHIEARYATVYDIHQWHINNTWAGIGYHFYIRKDGSIYRGRPEKARGAHCLGSNENSIGISCEGSFMTETYMTEAQKNSLIALGTYLRKKYNLGNVYGHRDLNQTDCPGTYFPLEEAKTSILK